jgi:Lon protease-like protein
MPGRFIGIDKLPAVIGVFPLTGALLLPRGHLPLNVFEPRYLALVDSALAGTRLIGMIQPTEHEDSNLKPPLSSVGCVGRITAFSESEDGRYQITLTGVCRFRVIGETSASVPFREVRADYAPYAQDLAGIQEGEFPRERLLAALKDYLNQRDMKADWKSIMTAPGETLINALAMMCPFEPSEKQALLEAVDFNARVATLIALLEMSSAEPGAPQSVN